MGAAPLVPEVGGDDEGIDVLSDGVLAHIPGFLPAEEAVRTSVLARRWRDLWKSATVLHIVATDGQFLETVEKSLDFVARLITHREGSSLDTCNLEVGHFSVLCGICHNEDVTRCLSTWFQDRDRRQSGLAQSIRAVDSCAVHSEETQSNGSPSVKQLWLVSSSPNETTA
ncbi:hypothetical protein PR202_gb16277 [Eleusine coracana subsp. coracana]|uniref:Uncharacterized protein n=1 Tax=Eleusine coracana subsp. coracana TaxID=191504 RepID=A0AAV5F029_ELECO|nr:hypothetical protein PR202_gb16277 [Eleusine coracana subsp. coracana]